MYRRLLIISSRSSTKTFFRFAHDSSNISDFLGMNGGKIIAEKLKSLGVKRVFGVPGTKLLPVLDSVRKAGINYVMARHEQGATFMSEGYASSQRSDRVPGVVLVSSGPGMTNILTPLYDAFYQNLPIIIFSSQVPMHLRGTMSFQETKAVDITKTCSKWATEALDAPSLPQIIDEAYKIATSGRPGPVYVDVPENVLHQELKENSEPNAGVFAPHDLHQGAKNQKLTSEISSQISEVAEKVNKSLRPLLIIGHAPGLDSDAIAKLRHLIAKTEIPYTSTFLGWGSLDDQDLHALHMFGTNGSVCANFAVQNADCVVAVGEGIDDYFVGGTPGDGQFARGAQAAATSGTGGLFHIAHGVPRHFKRWMKPTLTIDADYYQVIVELLKTLKPASPEHKQWAAQCQIWKSQYPLKFDLARNSNGPFRVEAVLSELNSQLDEKFLKDKLHIVTGVGNHQVSAAQYIRLPHAGRVTSSWTFATMGFGVPAAIGVQFAHKDALVINIDGDGSFGMTAMEVATAVDHQLPIKVLIVNNKGHGMMKQSQDGSFQTWYQSAEIRAPSSWAQVAEALGARGLRVDNYGDLRQTVSKFLDEKGPVVLEAVVDRSNYLYPANPRWSIVHLRATQPVSLPSFQLFWPTLAIPNSAPLEVVKLGLSELDNPEPSLPPYQVWLDLDFPPVGRTSQNYGPQNKIFFILEEIIQLEHPTLRFHNFGNFNPIATKLSLNGDMDLVSTTTKKLTTNDVYGSVHENYAHTKGVEEIRQLLADHLTTELNQKVPIEDVMLTNGCQHALQLTTFSLCDPGTNVLLPKPGYPVDEVFLKPSGVEARYYRLILSSDGQHRIDLEHMESLIDQKTSTVILNNPSNPTGAVYPPEHLEEFAKILERHRIPLIADELYSYLAFGAKFHSQSSIEPRVPMFLCDAISKRFLVPGWRLGWIVRRDRDDALAELWDRLGRMAHYINGPCRLAQATLETLLKETPPAYFQWLNRHLAKSSDIVSSELAGCTGLKVVKPLGGTSCLVIIDSGTFPEFFKNAPSEVKGVENFIVSLIKEESVYCHPGLPLNCPEGIRLNLCHGHDVLLEASVRIRNFYERHASS